MFGLLGGLVGRAIGGGIRGAMMRPRTPLGGLLRIGQNLAARSRASAQPAQTTASTGIPQQSSEGQIAQQSIKSEPQPQSQDQPMQPAMAEGKPLVQDLSPVFRDMAPAKGTLGGLLDPSPAIEQSPDPVSGRMGAPVVASRNGAFPVARQVQEMFGNVPGVPQADAPPIAANIFQRPGARTFPIVDAATRTPDYSDKNSQYTPRMQQAPTSSYFPTYSYRA